MVSLIKYLSSSSDRKDPKSWLENYQAVAKTKSSKDSQML